MLALSVLATCFAPSAAAAKSAPDKGIAWQPKPVSKALYLTKSADEDRDRQRHYVEAHDGTDLFGISLGGVFPFFGTGSQVSTYGVRSIQHRRPMRSVGSTNATANRSHRVSR